jgi:protein tyrosine phosphatase (PTP) superfamily phosphohydrolase (DUF442 family)
MKLHSSSWLGLVAAGMTAFTGLVSAWAAAPEELPGIHNFIHASTNVFSGSQPEGDAAFAALAKLGVKTVISVDGAKPEVELAAKHGLRYIHLPIGYDGIPTNRVAEFAKAAATVEGPIFVHCHHGKHRGPAAVGVICLATGSLNVQQAEAFLRDAGTSPEYPGLFRAVTNFVPPTAAQLAAVSTNFPSVVRTTSLVEAMVAIDAHYEHLKAAQKAGWRTPSAHPDISPAHEATLLWEQLRELARTDDTARRSDDYRTKLAGSERDAEALRALLSTPPSEFAAADAALKRIGQSCVDCHRRYRNE